MGDEPSIVSRISSTRGTRACTVCRQAKMKCVGAEDGKNPCVRCLKSNSVCVFERHKRGRKPGSKLSEASKMLRVLEKGLNTAKLKNKDISTDDAKLKISTVQICEDHPCRSSDARPFHNSREESPEEDFQDGEDEAMIPARVISREQKRTSFFHTILNECAPATAHSTRHTHPVQVSFSESGSMSNNFQGTSLTLVPSPPTGFQDPITAGLLTEAESVTLFDLIFLRLNPFINLFDPSLHSVSFVRQRCPLLLCTLLAAGCKFWKSNLYEPVRRMAKEAAVRAFAEDWKSVEVCQAFACLTYWREPNESKTWTYIGFACRLAVELGLYRYTFKPPTSETEHQRRDRRNRERTYLVLWVHDRSLSMQTGRLWMLPESPLVANSHTWHLDNGACPRPEDVIISAFVQLRRIGAETTDVFLDKAGVTHTDVNYEVVLHGCNAKLTRWMDHWSNEMKQAGGQLFQLSMLRFFRLHVRLFLNTFGLQSSDSKDHTNLYALSACYESGLQSLQIICSDFLRLNMLPYCQDSMTVMTAYSAVCLLRLLRKTQVLREWKEENATEKIYSTISETADAFQEAVVPGQTTSSAEYHARFLRALVDKDRRSSPVHEHSHGQGEHSHCPENHRNNLPDGYECPMPDSAQTSALESLQSMRQPILSGEGGVLADKTANISDDFTQNYATVFHEGGEELQYSPDQVYWRNMHIELGLNGVIDSGFGKVSSLKWAALS